MKRKYDWVERILFILFSYAHITDWEVSDSERSIIESKTRFIFKIIYGDPSNYESNIVEKKMIGAFEYWKSFEKQSIDEILSELHEISTRIVSQDWFNIDFAEKLIEFLSEVAKADGVVLQSEKFTLLDLANLWKVNPRL